MIGRLGKITLIFDRNIYSNLLTEFQPQVIASGIPIKIIFTFEIPKDVTQLSGLDMGYNRKRILIPNISIIPTK